MKPPIRKNDQNVDPLYFEELDLNLNIEMTKKDEIELRQAMTKQIKLKEELQSIAGTPAFDGRIHRAGALALAQALKKNKTLTELSVAQNNITNDGAERLLDSLKDHPAMMALDISGANLNEQIIGKLVKILNRRLVNSLKESGSSFRYLIITGSELGRDAVKKLQVACEKQGITLHSFEDSPLLELEQLDADDDPMKEVREVQRKVHEKNAQEALRSRFVIYSEDFPYESKELAIKDNFNRCPENWQTKLRAAAELDNPAPLQKLVDELENLSPEPEAKVAPKAPDKKYKRTRHT